MSLPDAVVLDTSFVFEALVDGQTHHAACQDYIIRLAAHGTELLYSTLLEIELSETAMKYSLLDRHGKRWKRMRNDGRARPRAARFMDSVLDAWSDLLKSPPHRAIAIDEVADRVPDLMTRFGLGSYDAVHAATAIHSGVHHLVTIDAGFGNLPANDITLYVDRTRVASCRRRRR